MIYKLYVNIAGWSQLDFDFDKKSIIDTMVCDNKLQKHTYYMIVEEIEELGPQVDILRNQEEIDQYVATYKEQQELKNMSILDLKREIVKNTPIKTLKK